MEEKMDFLKDFTKRMKSVGRYAMLLKNSMNKLTWKQYQIETLDEQINLIFTVLLYVMEASLKEEPCTLDDVAAFLGEINDVYYRRELGYEDYKELADFIINVILGNSGEVMYFQGYDYEKKAYTGIHVQYLANKVVYLENGIRRTSYYLTEDGYNMVLSTMEMENNLKLTVHEMLFKMHLEKADYGRAVHDIKSIFEQLRIQNQKIQSTMHRIRQNALSYSVEEYEQIVEENIQTIEKTREQFRMHREFVEEKVAAYEEEEIEVLELGEKDKESLEQLKIIRGYLNKTLDEHQRIFKEHLDLKTLYDRELENYSNMTLVQRIHFRSELYEPILMDAGKLENLHEFFTPLFRQKMDKIYHPGKALEYQRKLRKKEEEEESLTLGFDEEEFREEQERKRKERLAKYELCLTALFERMIKHNGISLKNLLEEDYRVCMPTVEIFREVMIELLTEECVDIQILKKEKREHFQDAPDQFQVNEMVLKIVEDKSWKQVHKIYARRSEKAEIIQFERVLDEDGRERNIKCSNVELWYE